MRVVKKSCNIINSYHTRFLRKKRMKPQRYNSLLLSQRESAEWNRDATDFHMRPASSPRLLPMTAFFESMTSPIACISYQTPPSNILQPVHHNLIMSTPRSKPLEKFVAASSKCTLEVCHSPTHLALPILIWFLGCLVWQMYRCRISECSQGHVCKGVHATKELLPGEFDIPLEKTGDANELLTGSSRQETMIA
jgi:hypothetical protein